MILVLDDEFFRRTNVAIQCYSAEWFWDERFFALMNPASVNPYIRLTGLTDYRINLPS